MRELSARMVTRGPDGSGYHGRDKFALAHERLAIMDPEHGRQPIVYDDGASAVCANGEIYNFRALQEKYSLPTAHTGSDSEVLLQLNQRLGSDMCNELNGIFGFMVCQEREDGTVDCIAARDHCGIKPLYMGKGRGDSVWFASELKALSDHCHEVIEFPPGHFWTPETGMVRYYLPEWDSDKYVPTVDNSQLRAALDKAVRDQCMSDVPFGLLLSGGLDSAVVGTILKPILEELGQEFLTFTVGQKGSPDATAAQMMSDYWGTTHHVHEFTSEEAFSKLDDIIYHLETYEPELIRSAIPNYFLARLAASKVKMVLTGEGSDELFGGYLYFRDAPDSKAFYGELRRIFWHLHNVNCQRADRMTMAHGLEARVPFLDPTVIATAMAISPEHKVIKGDPGPNQERPEKAALRELFSGEIPEPVLWRTKAMQCEGVGTTWVAELQTLCEAAVSDEEFATAAEKFTINTPQSKEEYYYRTLFEKHFAGMDRFVHVWEGGCRAAGAPWKNEAYTRFGLKDTSQLNQGLGLGDHELRPELGGDREGDLSAV